MNRRRLENSIAPVFHQVLYDALRGKHDEYWLKGGRMSTKSSFISLMILALMGLDREAHAIIYRKVADTLCESVFEQMAWALNELGWLSKVRLRYSPLEIEFLPTGQRILFRGADDPKKSKGIKIRNGYFRFLWFEELDEFGGMDEIITIRTSIIRGSGGRAPSVIYSYNPPKSINNWVNAEALRTANRRLVHHSSYLDVSPSWLGETAIRQAEEMKAHDEIKWRHVYMGEAVSEGGAVFDNLLIRAIPKDERSALKPWYGLDFGYSIDPSALMTVAYVAGARRLYVLNEYYKGGAGFEALERECKAATASGGQIWSDTEPRTIAELHSRGVPIAAAHKGQGSRLLGMQWLEDLNEIIIDPTTAPNAAREFTAFEHVRDPRTHAWRADYQDGNDHTIDAVRYACWQEIIRGKRKTYYSGKGEVV